MIALVSENSVWFFLFCFRYLRPLLCAWGFLRLRLIRPYDPERCTLTSQHVTVVIPCLAGDGIEDTLWSIIATEPKEIILVTIDANLEKAKRMVKQMDASNIKVLSVAQPNKRRQMVRAIPEVYTPVTIFADDDVTWPTTLLPLMLAPLEDEQYGGVGTNQRLRRSENPSISQALWEFLGAVYLQRRNFDCAACLHWDGGLPCLSGRTVAYRTKIISDDAFIHGFTNEYWGWHGTYQLNADDDNFITRWLVSHGHKIAMQYHRDAEVETELEDNPKYLRQCLRWARSNWRSNITTLFVERHVWSQQLFSVYAVFQTTFTHWAVLWDIGLLLFCPRDPWVLGMYLTVWFLSKIIKLLPLFVRRPSDTLMLPVSIMFGWLHGLIKLYAALTLHVTAWGSREGADENDSYRMIHIGPFERLRVAETRAMEIYTQ